MGTGVEQRGSRFGKPPRRRIRAVTLDATGTLFELVDLAGTYRTILARHGVELDHATLARLLPELWRETACTSDPARDRFASHPEGARGFWRDLVRRLFERALLPPPSRFLDAELFDTFARAEPWRIFPEVLPLLDELARRQLALAVVSNWDERLPRLLSALGLLERFDVLVFSQEVGVEKPHRAIFEAALERLGVAPHETLHVGDRKLEDAEGARAAGLEALWLVRAGGGEIATLAEVPAVVDQLG